MNILNKLRSLLTISIVIILTSMFVGCVASFPEVKTGVIGYTKSVTPVLSINVSEKKIYNQTFTTEIGVGSECIYGGIGKKIIPIIDLSIIGAGVYDVDEDKWFIGGGFSWYKF